MKKIVSALALTLALTSVAHAAPPTAAQKVEFYKVCFGIAENEALCTCKAEAAMTLIDSDFIAVVIASMRGKALDHQYDVAYNDYIARSTEACGMGSSM